MELELDVVDGVKANGRSSLGGVGVAGMMVGVPGCLNGVAVLPPLGLGLGLPFKPSYFVLAPGESP